MDLRSDRLIKEEPDTRKWKRGENIMKRKKAFLMSFVMSAALLCPCASWGEEAEAAAAVEAEDKEIPRIETTIKELEVYGNLILDVKPEEMMELGYEPADIILVELGDNKLTMPIGDAFWNVDMGSLICCYNMTAEDGSKVELSINMDNMALALGIAEFNTTDEGKGYEWIWADGYGPSTPVYLSMVEKQGYAEEYAMHQLGEARTNNREDYAELSDAEYANFREADTTGMGAGALYRTSSPIDPSINRNHEADRQLGEAGVRTILNLADAEESMKEYPEYDQTNYSKCDILALNMGMDLQNESFKEKLCKGFQFMASHEGPYLIHCQEGKDRTGFVLAILECLMGASPEEVVEDYMVTFYNFYGIEPEAEQYDYIAESNIETSLAVSFMVSSIYDPEVDLAVCTEAYLKEIGMSDEEIAALKSNLAKDYLEAEEDDSTAAEDTAA